MMDGTVDRYERISIRIVGEGGVGGGVGGVVGGGGELRAINVCM